MPNFVAIVKENADAVVAIDVTVKQPIEVSLSELSIPEGRNQGSGFIISNDGYILTNYHVIREADKITIRFKDLHKAIAKLVGVNKAADIALLKVNASGLAKVKVGSASSLEVGEWVIAIGSPFGFDQSVTRGIVSGKDRRISSEVNVPFIQTDTVINQGNSGGPLFNQQGEVIGINSWIFSKSGNYEGLSFAIPIDLAMSVVEQIKNSHRISGGWLGIKTRNVPLHIADALAIPRNCGALIAQIAVVSPAQQAGLKVGDIVIGFNQQYVESSEDLANKVRSVPADAQINLEVIRKGERIAITVKMGSEQEV